MVVVGGGGVIGVGAAIEKHSIDRKKEEEKKREKKEEKTQHQLHRELTLKFSECNC